MTRSLIAKHVRYKLVYTESDSKIRLCQGGALNLSQALPALSELNLNKLSERGGLKGSGCPTPAEPIFESRAVYTHENSKIGKTSFCRSANHTKFIPHAAS